MWFGFDEPVDRRTYVLHGIGLMACKYAVDAGVIWAFTGRLWSPADYFRAARLVQVELLAGAPPWLAPALLVFALPFLWIGVSMSLRRALDAGKPGWLSLLFFLPVVNYFLMGLLALLPTADRLGPAPVPERTRSALLGAAAAVGITLATVLVAIQLRRVYSAGLFLGTPFTIGYFCSALYNRSAPRTSGQSIAVALGGVLVASCALVLFALEGAACVILAFPLAALAAIPGALLARAMARRFEPLTGMGAAILFAPALVAVEPAAQPPEREVVTAVEVEAPPTVVWDYVVHFPDLSPPTALEARTGLAFPIRARIDGAGVGAVRYCDFTTGSFTEPIVGWEPERLLAFDITGQAPPMRELNPFGPVDAPHLDGYFRATHGEFRLQTQAGGHTRLEGRTRYQIAMFPQAYWGVITGAAIERIHIRVLAHIQRLAERNGAAR